VQSRPSHGTTCASVSANTRILHFDTAAATELMTFIAFYLLGKDEVEPMLMPE
jgi:hypothetical protein